MEPIVALSAFAPNLCPARHEHTTEKTRWTAPVRPATITEPLSGYASGVSMLDEGVCAEVKVGSEHLRLFSEQNAQGVQVSVYNVNAKNWIAPSESVETIEQGKLKAATYAEGYLRQVANLELPVLKWKEARAV